MSHDPSDGTGKPADDLHDVWEALDVLPRAAASVDMAATTVDLAAVTADRRGFGDTLGRGMRLPVSPRGWLRPALAVAGSLLVGVVLGRVTAPDPDRIVLESLPLIRHLGLLREAGSVTFLKSLASRRPQPPARQVGLLQDEAREFDAAIADLEQDHALGAAARPRAEARREALAGLPADEREIVERAAAVFEELPQAKRSDMAAVAAVLASPAQGDLRAAARLWHLIIAASDPADRKNIIDLDADERLEWLERRSRWREMMSERRGLPPAGEGVPPRGPGPAGGGGGGEGRPRWQGPRGERGGPNGPPPGERGPRGDGSRPRPQPPERREPPTPRDSDAS